jgi:hypothetical protein
MIWRTVKHSKFKFFNPSVVRHARESHESEFRPSKTSEDEEFESSSKNSPGSNILSPQIVPIFGKKIEVSVQINIEKGNFKIYSLREIYSLNIST